MTIGNCNSNLLASRMRTVTLEFLRHGPPHGQLLSPLARYMALCGAHEPSDVSVPFDHAELLTRLRALLYKDTAETTELQLGEMARAMSDVLAAVPGLVAELSDSGGAEISRPTHLRILFNANELALLPFELASAASAFPGAGQSLALQPQVPLCITREVRRAADLNVQWPRKPKILFAAASAGGEIPVEAHLLALRQVIEPWMWHYDEEDTGEWQSRVDEHLTFLPNATVDGLLDACASGGYTHVHLLAHGVAMDRDLGRRYGLALHNSRDVSATDVVDGVRLATLLRPQVKGRLQELARPSVVSIAACDSGNVGSVIGAGASIAHALHEAGIPLVVASQFPLTFAGSVVLAQVLYEGAMSGADPRMTLIDLRRQLKVRVRGSHDWASVVAYASFPLDLEAQIAKVRVKRASASIDAALSHADRATKAFSKLLSAGSNRREITGEEKAALLRVSHGKLEKAMDRLLALLKLDQDKAGILGLLASAEKRKSEIFFRDEEDQANRVEGLLALAKSRRYYRSCFETDRSQSWGLVQALVLAAVLDGEQSLEKGSFDLARLLTIRDLDSDNRQERAWANSNALELHLLAGLTGWAPEDLPEWQTCIKQIIRAVGSEATEVHSTRRQLSRWVELFPKVWEATKTQRQPSDDTQQRWNLAQSLAEGMFRVMPEPPKFS